MGTKRTRKTTSTSNGSARSARTKRLGSASPTHSNGQRQPADPLALMTPAHLRWEEFVVRLAGPEGCFEYVMENNQFLARKRCRAGEDKRYARRILRRMGGLDVKGSLAYFEEHGGYCDCEILLNVETGAIDWEALQR